MKNGEIDTGSVTVNGDAISLKYGLWVGSPVHYLAFFSDINTLGEGWVDGSTVIWSVMIGFGMFIITLGVREPKPKKTPV